MTPAQLAKRNRRALLAAERRAQRDLIRIYGLAFGRLTDQIATLQHAITDAQGAGVSTQRLAARQQAAANLLVGMQTELGQYVLQATPTITALQRAHAQRAIGDSLDLIRAALGSTRGHPVSIEFRPPSADVVLRLIGNASDGTPLGDLLHEVVSGQVGKARDELAVGIARGDGPREIARRFADVSGETLDRSLVIARQESLRAYRQVSTESFKVNPAVTSWVWTSARDVRTCFPAGTFVSGPKAVASSARHYAGELIMLQIAGREDLSVTPNHPMLTRRGWVPAGLLQEGDHVLGSAAFERTAAPVDEHDQQVPARIEEVAQAVGMVAMEVPTAAPDFHGDGMDPDVDVVRPDGLLSDGGHASFKEPGGEDDLRFGHVHGLALRGSGLTSDSVCPQQLGVALVRIADDLAGGRSLAQGHRRTDENLALCEAPPFDVHLAQTGGDGSSGHAEVVGERLLGFTGDVAGSDLLVGEAERSVLGGAVLRSSDSPTGLVAPEQAALSEDGREALSTHAKARSDALRSLASEVRAYRILKVRRRSFSGHVYNLQTGPHWYLAEGIIVANCAICWALDGTEYPADEPFTSHISCRCSALPRSLSWADLGFPDVPDNRPATSTGPEAFAELTADEQRKILGSGKYREYRAGRLRLEDLPRRTSSERWGSGRREATLTEVLAA